MTTKKGLQRKARMNRPEAGGPPKQPWAALGIAVAQALAKLGVETLYLPTVSTKYNVKLEKLDFGPSSETTAYILDGQEVSQLEFEKKFPNLGAKFVLTPEPNPKGIRITVEVGK